MVEQEQIQRKIFLLKILRAVLKLSFLACMARVNQALVFLLKQCLLYNDIFEMVEEHFLRSKSKIDCILKNFCL